MTDLIIVNPPTDNPYPNKAIEPPIWCAYLARQLGGDILDAQNMSPIEMRDRIGFKKAIFVAMGSNPSASSTPKMPAIEKILADDDQVAGLHPQAVRDPRGVVLPQPHRLAQITPDWGSTDFSKYRAHNWHTLGQDPYGYGVIYTSFGCIFDCYTCNIHTLYGTRKVYYRTPDDIEKEIEFMVARGVRHLKICDELFTLKATHVENVCKILRKYNLNVWAYARVGTVSSAMLRKMKESGINWLAYGFESASQDVRGNISKKTSDIHTANAIRMTREAGISIIGNFMFGLPGDTVESMQATVDWAEEQNFEYVNYYVAMPYPGSQWYEDAKLQYTTFEEFSQFSETMNPKAKAFRDRAFIHYFKRLAYLKMIERKYGAAKEILEMIDGH